MFRKILLAYDGSTFGAPALQQTADLAHACNAELHLLGVVLTTGYMALAEGINGAVDLWGMEHKSLESAMDAAVRDLGQRGVTIISSIQEGDPGAVIASYAHEIKADLVVIGHSGKGIIARWLEGSVGSKLLSDLPCSLLIIAGET